MFTFPVYKRRCGAVKIMHDILNVWYFTLTQDDCYVLQTVNALLIFIFYNLNGHYLFKKISFVKIIILFIYTILSKCINKLFVSQVNKVRTSITTTYFSYFYRFLIE